MKKSFMTRALATGLSLAMAFSLSAATNVTVASAASTPTMASKQFAVRVGGATKTYKASAATLKTYRITKATVGNSSKATVAVASSKKGIKVTPGTVTGSTVVKVTFKNSKTKKSTAKKFRCVVKPATEDPKPDDNTLAIESVTATKVNELTVTFKNAVTTSGTSIAVTKGSENVATASETWSDDTKTLVIKTKANMINGTYTVTVKNATEETSGNAEVKSQQVTAIKILNKVALTTAYKNVSGSAADATGALVYYDVVDQYGESMRNSTNIDWSTSCKVAKNDKTLGLLTLIRTDDKAFTYGESIYVTGVHAKTGVSVSETLTIGAKQALNTVEVKGFVKKGTSEILPSLPAGFKSKAYYLVYSVLDQNGNSMEAGKYMGSDGGDAEVTFISDNILVLKEISRTQPDDETVLTLDGVEYCAAFVEPGIDVNKGGEVNITAIANKTGNKSSFNVVVGNDQILKSFTMSQPGGIVADGENVEIPFTALDQNGKAITNFVTLASQSDFNRLQLNASYGTFMLYEKNDGTAGLRWTDKRDPGDDGAWNSNSEDGIDRPISLTAVVVGGETSNEMIYVSDKAMPVAIDTVDINSIYVQGSEKQINMDSFTFIDQYGRTMEDDNGFFARVNGDGLTGTDYRNYHFGIAVEFKGDVAKNLQPSYASAGTCSAITRAGIKYHIDQNSSAAFATTKNLPFTVSADQTLKFSIEKTNDNKDYSNVSPVKNYTFKVVNIDQVSGFEIKDLKTVYVHTNLSDKLNGAVGGLEKGDMVSSSGITKLGTPSVGNGQSAYIQTVEVTGKYNGVTVDVPASYYTVAGSKVGAALSGSAISTSAIGANAVSVAALSTTTGALTASDLYDANSAQFTRKLAEDTLKVTVYKRTASGAAVEATEGAIHNTATKKIYISDAEPYANEICAADAYTVIPYITQFSNAGSEDNRLSAPNTFLWETAAAKEYRDTYKVSGTYWKVLDQYGIEIAADSYAYKIASVKENAGRYAENNFSVDKNDTADASVKGTECGDTFTLTISATAGKKTATKDVKITVGADYCANITGSDNTYIEVLVDKDGGNSGATPGLETQRKASLGTN